MNLPYQVSVVVVNYNGAAFIRECLESICAQTPPVHETLVVDNGSTDGSADMVAGEFPAVRLIRMDGNRGYGAALNKGITATSGSIVVVANNDLKLCDGWVVAVCERFGADETCGQVASKVQYWDEPDRLNSVGTLLYADLTAVNKGLDEIDTGQYEVAEEVFGAYGAVMAFRRDVFDAIGLFDEDYFLFKEEDDITLRMRRAGWRAVYEPRARVLHKRSANTRLYSPLKLYYSERNRVWNVVKHLPFRCVLTTLPAVMVRYWAHFALCLNRSSRKSEAVARASKWVLFTTLLRAWCSALWGFRGVLAKRRQYQQASRLRYREVLQLLHRYRAGLDDMVK